MLAAPTAPDERLPLIVERARGFVYGVGLLGITGVRSALAASAVEIAGRLDDVTEAGTVGVGVGTPEQAVEVSQVSDGVVVGSAACSACSTTLGPKGSRHSSVIFVLNYKCTDLVCGSVGVDGRNGAGEVSSPWITI